MLIGTTIGIASAESFPPVFATNPDCNNSGGMTHPTPGIEFQCRFWFHKFMRKKLTHRNSSLNPHSTDCPTDNGSVVCQPQLCHSQTFAQADIGIRELTSRGKLCSLDQMMDQSKECLNRHSYHLNTPNQSRRNHILSCPLCLASDIGFLSDLGTAEHWTRSAIFGNLS